MNDMSFKDWQAQGNDANSIIADPMFVDAENYDFHLKADSPALKIGFKPFDFTKAGVYGEQAWLKLAKSGKYTKSCDKPGK